jgi:hypothetical protein
MKNFGQIRISLFAERVPYQLSLGGTNVFAAFLSILSSHH